MMTPRGLLKTFVKRLRQVAKRATVVIAAITLPQICVAEGAFVSVGSGSAGGVYYKVSKSLCGLVNRELSGREVWCSPEATPGSVYNLQRLRTGELDFALVQSDVQFYAFTGSNAWLGNAFPGLRSVLSLHQELVTVLAPADSAIDSLGGLKGRRFNIGSAGSGTRATWDALEGSLGWSADAGVRKLAVKPDAAPSMLCGGDLDAILLLVGHPSPFVQRHLSSCGMKFVAMDGPQIDSFVSTHPYYERGAIQASAYGTDRDVPTFGVRATLVTAAHIEDKLVYALAKAVLSNLEEFKMLAPALRSLQASQAMEVGLTAPLHPGAERAFRELGISRGAAVR